MAQPANLRRTLYAVAVPLLLSLFLHGLLLLLLWIWPARTHGTEGGISSTRISLETCLLDIGSPRLQPTPPVPPDLAGPDVSTTMDSRLLEAPPLPKGMAEESTQPANAIGMPAAVSPGPSQGSGADGADGGGLFPHSATAASVVFVLDRSVSMADSGKLDRACRELLANLRQLAPVARFQIICYSDYAAPLLINGQTGLLPAEPTYLREAARVLQTLTASGPSRHTDALRRGLALRPDVLYLITDADELPYGEMEAITRDNSTTAIHIIELTRRRTARPDGPLARLARTNGGTYRHVPVSD